MQACEPYGIHKNRLSAENEEDDYFNCQISSDDIYERVPQ